MSPAPQHHRRDPSGTAPGPPRDPAVVAVIATPIGPIHAAAIEAGIVALELHTTDEAFRASVTGRTRRALVTQADAAASDGACARLAGLEEALRAHLAGEPGALADLPVVLEGMTEWDRRVLEGVRTIPWGATAGYGEVARLIGAPGAARAVGGAVGRNPVGLLVPCHRVVAGDGTLGGYGGSWFGDREELLRLKERLLAIEGVRVPRRT